MKTIIYYLPYLPLYILTFAGLLLIIYSFISMFFKNKSKKLLPVKKQINSFDLDAIENNELYLLFKNR